MTNKIFASLKNDEQVILFDEQSIDYNEVIKLFGYDVENFKSVSFLKNLHSTLKEDEIYFIKLTADKEKELFTNILLTINSIDNNKAKEAQYSNIDVIYLIDTTKKIVCLKKIYPTQHIGAKKLLGFGDLGPTYRKEANKINLSSKVNVYYNIDKKILYFKNFNNLINSSLPLKF